MVPITPMGKLRQRHYMTYIRLESSRYVAISNRFERKEIRYLIHFFPTM